MFALTKVSRITIIGLLLISLLPPQATSRTIVKQRNGGGGGVDKEDQQQQDEHICDANSKCAAEDENEAGMDGVDVFNAWVDGRIEEGAKLFRQFFSDTDLGGQSSADEIKERDESNTWSNGKWKETLERRTEALWNEFFVSKKGEVNVKSIDDTARNWFEEWTDVLEFRRSKDDVNGKEEEINEDEDDILRNIMSAFSSISGFRIKKEGDDAVDEASAKRLIERAIAWNQEDKSKSFKDIYQIFTDSFSEVKESIDRSFKHVETYLRKASILSLFYYIEREDATKNPSWKRRKHRFQKKVDVKVVNSMHDALYLADTSYSDSVDKIKARLGTTQDGWELVYAQLESEPNKPSHFIALKKEQRRWSDTLEVLITVRGTKQIGDLLSDALLDAVEYRGGLAHSGITSSGRYLAEKHLPFLNGLLDMSKKKRLRIFLIGHSLGAGAASIAAMEFNDEPHIEATVIGFGCPALLSKDLSESTEAFITTVVADADVVPRMSGATVANALLDIISHDWTVAGLRDLAELLDQLNGLLPIDIPQQHLNSVLDFVNATLERTVKPLLQQVPKERMELTLIPPGKCIHLYRDGYGISGSHTPCDFFDSIDLARTVIDDHLIPTGYHRILLEVMRNYYHDLNFAFWHDISGDY